MTEPRDDPTRLTPSDIDRVFAGMTEPRHQAYRAVFLLLVNSDPTVESPPPRLTPSGDLGREPLPLRNGCQPPPGRERFATSAGLSR